MTYQFTYTARFQKHFKKFSSREKALIQGKLKLLTENPLHPSLRTKRIQGTGDLFESSVNMDIRIIWFYEGSQIIFLLDIGHHDILNQY